MSNKNHWIQIRCTKEEKEKIEKYATNDKSISAFMLTAAENENSRRVLSGFARRCKTIPIHVGCDVNFHDRVSRVVNSRLKSELK